MTQMHEMTVEQVLARASVGSPGCADAVQALRVAEAKVALRENELSGMLLKSYGTRYIRSRSRDDRSHCSVQKLNRISELHLSSRSRQYSNSSSWVPVRSR